MNGMVQKPGFQRPRLPNKFPNLSWVGVVKVYTSWAERIN